MAINFFCQSYKDYAPITIRYTDTYSDAKTRTPLYIKKDRLVKSKVIKYKIGRSLSVNEKNDIRAKNLSLEKVELAMVNLERLVLDAINELPRRTVITSKWLKSVVNQTNRLNLSDHIENWKSSKKKLTPNSKIAINSFVKFMDEYTNTDILLSDIDLNYFDNFKTYCDYDVNEDKIKDGRFKEILKTKNYSTRSINLKITYILAVCDFAEARGHKLNFNRKHVKRISTKTAIKSYLTEPELNDIINLEIKPSHKVKKEDLETARDWLIISCFTAMRSSDMFNLTNSNIKGGLIVYSQQKTDSTDVEVPILDPVKTIIKRYKGFPPKSTNQPKQTWSQRYQRHIRIVCEMAGIDEMVKGKDGEKTEKYNTITTHIGRMSFATNFYENRNISTVEIMGITGHSSEKQLLTYINKDRKRSDKNDLADRLNQAFGY